MRLSEVDEEELLGLITPLLPRGDATLLGPGDDAAVVATSTPRFVVTTDVLVEGRHFRRDWSSGAEIGARAVAANLADVAAMGATPISLVTSLVLPPDVDVDFVVDLARGLGQEAGRWRVGAVGGDLSSGNDLTIAITANGDLGERDAITRSGAEVGDLVAHAGTLGYSAAGLALLQQGYGLRSELGQPGGFDLPGGPGVRRENFLDADAEVVMEKALAIFRTPVSPIDAALRAAYVPAHAMMDVSDGLVRDAARIAKASGGTIDLDSQALATRASELAPIAEKLGANPMDWVLGGGEDHGFLATFDAGIELPEGFTAIGSVQETEGTRAGASSRVLLDGEELGDRPRGWDHFAQ